MQCLGLSHRYIKHVGSHSRMLFTFLLHFLCSFTVLRVQGKVEEYVYIGLYMYMYMVYVQGTEYRYSVMGTEYRVEGAGFVC